MLEFQCKVSEYANDHLPDLKRWHLPRPAVAVAGVMICALALTMNASTIVTGVVLNASDQVLLTAMEISPDALAHVLNAVDVGE